MFLIPQGNPNFLRGWAEYFCDVIPTEIFENVITAVDNSTLIDGLNTTASPISTVTQALESFDNSTIDNSTSFVVVKAGRLLNKLEISMAKKRCYEVKPKDSTAAMAIILLMFVIPSKPTVSDSKALVTWDTIQKRLAWGLLFMRGGGFSIAHVVEVKYISSIRFKLNLI